MAIKNSRMLHAASIPCEIISIVRDNHTLFTQRESDMQWIIGREQINITRQ